MGWGSKIVNKKCRVLFEWPFILQTFSTFRCQNKSGGFGGGPGQISHLAPTYAAVNALSILGGEVMNVSKRVFFLNFSFCPCILNERSYVFLQDALKVIDRPKLMSWLNRLRLDDGSFMMHENDGEVDIRGVYCALSVARLTNVFTPGLYNHFYLPLPQFCQNHLYIFCLLSLSHG